MGLPENPVYGRKIFFLRPPYNVSEFVLKRLREEEYEIYVINDYREVKNILRHYPDSICFLNIDEQLSTEQWYHFILSFEIDPTLQSILIGILASRLKKSEKEHFFLHASIPAGIVPTNGGMEDLTETIKAILELNGAKGRRQYVRVKCCRDHNAAVLFTADDKPLSFRILDISTVGLACSISCKLAPQFQPNTVLRDITIVLGTKKIKCSGAIFAVKTTSTSCSLVILFMKGTSFMVKNTIRSYISRNLQYEMRLSIQGEHPDISDYSVPIDLRDTEKDAFLVTADDSDDIITAPDLDSVVQDIDSCGSRTDTSGTNLTTTSLF